MNNKVFKSAIAAIAIAGVFVVAQPQGHAMINGTESYLTGQEYHDAPIYQQKVVSKYVTVGYQETKNGKKIRHANLVFENTKQTRYTHNRGNASAEYDIRMMRNGEVYIVSPSYATGYNNPAYHIISKGHSKTINGVKVGWGKNDTLYFKWSDNIVSLATKSTSATKAKAVKYNGTILGDDTLQVNNSTTQSHANWRTRVVKAAKSLKYGRYVYNGHTLSAGTDCAGFTELAYLLAGKQDIGSTTSSQHSRMRHISLYSVKPGDIVWHWGHVAMYVGHGQILQDLEGGVRYSAYHPGAWKTALRVK
ncbi:peptidoglycan endopeptidase [Periweissella cryptocerci]|uniref:Peptidoglycan endopeptidase n=1 Tax=Periweissella cryptocerci TaxID=2506420 RepID=A0A4P6YSR2_9LACO|nr:NlpC/P60 family protein [Periweissella cryptocerci]QBO35769.1 peptidoglycan endopeptidase [Periweissella cryptocerci]